MTREECANAWKTVVQCYKDTITINDPKTTILRIVNTLGLERTKEIFATISKIKEHDGRINSHNREYLKTIVIDAHNIVWERSNSLIRAGLDDIHTAHINNLITELRRL